MTIKLYVAGPADYAIEELLLSRGMRATSSTANDLRELAHPHAPQPDVLLLDLRADAQLPPAISSLRRQHPTTPIVAIAPKLDPMFMLDAMRAGVNECIASPVTGAGLEAAIARVMAQRPVTEPASTFAFIGAKGGVGSTTLAVNVATVISQMTQSKQLPTEIPPSTLLMDLHLAYGDCTVFLGAEPRFTIADALENTHRFDEAFFRGVVARTAAGPDLLASSDRLMVTPVDARRVQALIEFASHHYRYTILDLPRSDAVVLDALGGVGSIVVVVNQDLATLRSARAIAGAMRQRYGKEKVRVVLSRPDSGSEIDREDVEEAIGERLAFTFPSDYRASIQALNRGKPVALQGEGKLADALRRFTTELTGLKADAAPHSEERTMRLLPRLALVRGLLS